MANGSMSNLQLKKILNYEQNFLYKSEFDALSISYRYNMLFLQFKPQTLNFYENIARIIFIKIYNNNKPEGSLISTIKLTIKIKDDSNDFLNKNMVQFSNNQNKTWLYKCSIQLQYKSSPIENAKYNQSSSFSYTILFQMKKYVSFIQAKRIKVQLKYSSNFFSNVNAGSFQSAQY
ncbi:hypothetical protein ABPG72_021184 [Tetrahymena utriculariae]